MAPSPVHLNQYAQQHGLTFQQVLDRMEHTVAHTDPQQLSEKERRYLEYTRLNLQRMRKWLKLYRPSPDALEVVQAIKTPMLFLVISEDWCGDAAQVIPCLYKLIESNPVLDMRFIDRDQHLNIMDMFLTDGKRKIPIVVALDASGKELFCWGPRPKPAERVYLEARDAGLSSEAVQERLHGWYAKDRCQTVEQEFCLLFRTVGIPTASR